MSYTILYRSMFLRMSNGTYIPMVEMGDNNVYESTGGRRARNWERFPIGDIRKKLSYTKNEILQEIEKMIDKKKKEYVNTPKNLYDNNPNKKYRTFKDIEKEFGYFSGLAVNGHWENTSANKLRNFFKKGFEQAISFETDKIELRLMWYNPEFQELLITSENELTEEYQKLTDKNIYPYVAYTRWCGDILWEKHKITQPKSLANTKQERESTLF